MAKNKRTKELINEMKIKSGGISLDIDHLYLELKRTKDEDKFINDFSDYLEKLNK